MKTPLLAWLMLTIAGIASAQNPTPGLPAVSTHTPVDVVPTTEQEAEPSAPASAESSVEGARSAALLRLVEEATARSRVEVRPPPPDVTMESGKSTTIPISLGTLNRIQTPFDDPVVTHGTTVAVERRGAVVYVSSNDPAPAAIFISPRSDDSLALALTVRPSAGLDPVSVRLHLAGYEPGHAPVSPAAAAEFEASQPYVDTLKALFRELALGQVPNGYGFTRVDGSTVWMPRCHLPGVSLSPRQVLEGGNVVAVVARAVNVSIDTTEIDESACGGEGVLAVAAWPTVLLEPGQETEIYIAIRRPDDAGAARRPSALKHGG